MESESRRGSNKVPGIDRRINEYNILDKVLGQGAFGEVKLVQSKEDDKKVFALKTRSKHLIAEKGMRDHVLNEYRIMKEIEHPNIVRVHCAMQDEHHLYLLMDLLPGKCSVVIQKGLDFYQPSLLTFTVVHIHVQSKYRTFTQVVTL